MGGCIKETAQQELYNRSFLPTWEGVSEQNQDFLQKMRVSSLHGRVYRTVVCFSRKTDSFLPTWEGVSTGAHVSADLPQFPPYMGGCIESETGAIIRQMVSSLHGRVYRGKVSICSPRRGFLPTWEGVSVMDRLILSECWFPPYMGGCIVQCL